MDWKQFFAAVISSIAWPVAVISLAGLLRHPLSQLIPLIRTLKIKDLQIDLGERLDKVKAEVEATTDELVPDATGIASYVSVAEIDPRAAMLSAWLPVERELREIADKVDLPPYAQMWGLIGELIRTGVLDDDIGNTLLSMNRIRNDAVHLSGPEVDIEQALAMGELCERLTNRLKVIKSEVKAPSAG
ncbi:hypothetical protein LJG01_09095 [Pseudomonas aeruginosa]|uniref:hypothetical protein n=1 Tax=Pseudomonas aeruginosa TaxID=287 RepID=UPI0006770685|nr:hypothetical protein [Pseudomonas aeruginosa]MCC0279785.1 hypothetical protein [Pseudomonas aeruginosa]